MHGSHINLTTFANVFIFYNNHTTIFNYLNPKIWEGKVNQQFTLVPFFGEALKRLYFIKDMLNLDLRP